MSQNNSTDHTSIKENLACLADKLADRIVSNRSKIMEELAALTCKFGPSVTKQEFAVSAFGFAIVLIKTDGITRDEFLRSAGIMWDGTNADAAPCPDGQHTAIKVSFGIPPKEGGEDEAGTNEK